MGALRLKKLLALLICLLPFVGCGQVGARIAADKGFRSYNEKQFDDAIQYYEEARQDAPTNKTILRNLAYSYLAKARDTDLKEITKSDSDKAIELLTALLIQSPKDLELASVLLDAWMQAGRLDDAAHFFQNRIAKDPKDEEALRLLAVIEVQRGNYQAALDVYEKRKQLNPDDVQILASMATLCWEWLRAGGPSDKAAAIEIATKGLNAALEASKRDPKHPTVLVYAGLLLRERAKRQPNPVDADKDVQQAQDLLKKVQQSRPGK